jgi:hypothetical protein
MNFHASFSFFYSKVLNVFHVVGNYHLHDFDQTFFFHWLLIDTLNFQISCVLFEGLSEIGGLDYEDWLKHREFPLFVPGIEFQYLGSDLLDGLDAIKLRHLEVGQYQTERLNRFSAAPFFLGIILLFKDVESLVDSLLAIVGEVTAINQMELRQTLFQNRNINHLVLCD